MRRVKRFDELCRAPVGAYLASTCFAYWCPDPTLYGFALWGCPDEADMEQLFRFMEVGARPEAVVHDSLVDLSGLGAVDPAAFAATARYLAPRAEMYGARIARQARVRPSGLPGAIVAGLNHVVPVSYPTTIHATLAEAVAWLGRSEDLLDELEQIISEGMGELPIVERLRGVLSPPLRNPTIGSAAQALGLSARTLQRRLQREGTTFHAEVNAAQLRAAETLLRETDTKLETIAVEVGFRSLASFSTMFRRARGQTPSSFRQRARCPAGAPDNR